MLRNMTLDEFCRYLEMVAMDLEDSGQLALAMDYKEMIRRLDTYAFEAGRVLDYVVEHLGELS